MINQFPFFKTFLNQTPLPHALLLYTNGQVPRALLMALIQSIFCQNKTPFYCDQCKSCLDFKRNNLPDFFELVHEKEIVIEDIRLLAERVQYGPIKQAYYVALIPDADQMTIKAANAFLKLLEEPPENVCFLLTVSHLGTVMPTIKSRCLSVFIPQYQNLTLCPLSIHDVLKMPLMKRIDSIQPHIQNKQDALSALYYWLNQLLQVGTLDSHEQAEKMIKKIEALSYNTNVKLQLNALMLSL